MSNNIKFDEADGTISPIDPLKPSSFNTLGDASRLIMEKSLKVDENALTQYIKTAMEIVQARGESLEDYALIQVRNPMQLKEDKNSVTITTQWRLIHVDKLENVPEYDD